MISVFVGIDPGLRATGIVVGRRFAIQGRLETWQLLLHRTIKTTDQNVDRCISDICFAVKDALTEVGSVTSGAIEDQRLVQLGKTKQKRTSRAASAVRDVQFALFGMLCSTLASVSFVSPQEAKRAATGNPNATKAQVQRAIERRIRAQISRYANPDADAFTVHEADAFAVVLADEARLRMMKLRRRTP